MMGSPGRVHSLRGAGIPLWGVLWSLPLILSAGVVALATVWLDEQLVLQSDEALSLASARTFLATVAGTMVTATVVVFWIRGLLVGNRTNRFPARVLEGYLRDRGQLRLMGLMIGVFVYATMVLLALPPPGSVDAREEPVPTISVAAVTVLTVVALLAIVYSIDAGVRSMNEHRIMREILDRGLAVIETNYPDGTPLDRVPPELSGGIVLRSTRTGWIDYINHESLLASLPEDAVCHLEVRVGQFITPSTRLCRVHALNPDDAANIDVEAAITVGETRSATYDVSFAVRNLVDIAVSGLSAGGNDYTTGRDAVLHLGALLRPLVIRQGSPAAYHDDAGRWLVHDYPLDHTAIIDEAFEDLRSVSRDALTARTVLAVIDDLVAVAVQAGYHNRADHLRRHAELLVEGITQSPLTTADGEWVRQRASVITTLTESAAAPARSDASTARVQRPQPNVSA